MLLRGALVAWLAVACSAPPQPDAGRDAGDAGPRDAGRDGGARPRDAGPDGGRDAGPSDPGWVTLATLAPDCVVERATRPEALPAPRFAPCEEQPEECLRSVPGTGGGTKPAWFDGERGYFTLPYRDERDRPVLVVERTDGPPIAGWRTPPRREMLERNRLCRVWWGVGEGYAAIVASFSTSVDPTQDVTWVYHAPLDEIATVTEPLTIIAPGIFAQRIEVSAEVMALWTGPSVWGIGADGRQTVLDREMPGIPQNVTVVGGHVLWEDWADLVRVAHARMDEPASFFRRADPGDIKEMHSDGVELMWLEGYDRQPDGRYARLELWASPYAADPAALAPRLVRAMEERNRGAYGGGWYVMERGSPYRIEIVRTSDGTRREWMAPTGGSVLPVYVSDHEIMVEAGGLVRFDPHLLPVVE